MEGGRRAGAVLRLQCRIWRKNKPGMEHSRITAAPLAESADDGSSWDDFEYAFTRGLLRRAYLEAALQSLDRPPLWRHDSAARARTIAEVQGRIQSLERDVQRLGPSSHLV